RARGRRVDRIRPVEYAMGGLAIRQLGWRNRLREVPGDPSVLRSAENFTRSGRGRGREMGRLLAGNGEGFLSCSLLLRPGNAPQSQNPIGIDSLVVGRPALRMVAERSIVGWNREARAIPHLLAERPSSVSDEPKPVRASTEEMGSCRFSGRAPGAAS